MADQKTLIKERAELDLESFIRLVHPGSVLGQIHSEVIQWITREDAKSHQLLLLPRDHQKSRIAAYYAVWMITKNPAIRILYVSSTSNLAVKQLKFIKDILVSPIYRRYWPEMVNEDLGAREKWTETEISIDHPSRKAEAVRDPTVFTAGLSTSITGMHCDLAILDDMVTPENAYTEGGRDTVKQQYGYLASIEGADARELCVGTLYYPTDVYNDMITAVIEIYDEDGNIKETSPLYETFVREVEDQGDGSGHFLWPRERRRDGKWFGFNQTILATKKAQYQNKTHFRAQYYNDPNDTENAPISRELFQSFDPKQLTRFEGKWFYAGRRLNVFAGIDFAYSLKKRADFTAIVVAGVDADQNIYVLDIDRFKSGKISEYFTHILRLHQKWDFRKIRAEMTAAQEVLVRELKDNYIRPQGLILTIEERKPNRHEGTKKERINAALQPRYQDGKVWHPKDHPWTQALEEELQVENPAHDDIKDCLAGIMEIIVAPSYGYGQISNMRAPQSMSYHNRFGGIL